MYSDKEITIRLEKRLLEKYKNRPAMKDEFRKLYNVKTGIR